MIPNLDNFVFSQNFAVSQIRGCWFQIWQYHFQIPAQKYPNQAFLVPNLRIYIFAPNFAARQIERRWFQIWQQYFQIPAPKYKNLAILVPNLRIFNFCTKLGDADFKYDNVFSKLLPKTPKQSIFGSKFKNSNFCTKLCN